MDNGPDVTDMAYAVGKEYHLHTNLFECVNSLISSGNYKEIDRPILWAMVKAIDAYVDLNVDI